MKSWENLTIKSETKEKLKILKLSLAVENQQDVSYDACIQILLEKFDDKNE